MSANLDTTTAPAERPAAPLANLPTGLPGLDHAIRTLTKAGYTVARNVRYWGWDYEAPDVGRREGVHADELFEQAARVAATITNEEATR